MASRLSEFITTNQLLYKGQYGFRNKHSTQMAIIEMIDKIHSAMEREEYTFGLFLDYRKAFDTVNHTLLLAKLEYYGIRGINNQWFKSYLTDRTQYTTYNGTRSDINSVNCGVPQGSILGPLLFIIYINDMNLISDDTSLILFADDTNVFMSHNNLPKLEHMANRELKKIFDWTISNRLSLNLKKTMYMIFQPRKNKLLHNMNIKVDNTSLDTLEYQISVSTRLFFRDRKSVV